MTDEKKLLGVIGGLGPMATTHFMELVIAMTDAETDQENVDMIVYNFPSIPDRTGYILGSNLRSPLPGLLSVGNSLTRQGAKVIAIPCMTAHFFYEEMKAAFPVDVIHGVRETVRHLKDHGVTTAGIMATDGALASGLFLRELVDGGILPVLPSEQRQEDVMHLIYRNIKAGKPVEMERFRAVEQELRSRGAQAIILGCTELSLIKEQYPIGPGYLDCMEVLAQQAVLRCGGKLKEEFLSLIS